MGHQRIGTLKVTRKWKAVIGLITGGAAAPQVAAAAASAAEGSLGLASRNRSLRHAVWLLTQIPLAARDRKFGQALRALGLEVGDAPDLIEIGGAMLVAIDRVSTAGRDADDLSEMAAKAAAESLVAVASRSGQSLFGAVYAADETRASLRALSKTRAFGVLARDFMARLTQSCLNYYLGRILPEHVGAHRRFQSIKDHDAFDHALALHCRETALIVEQFACDWFSKTNYEGGITPAKAGGFLHYALRKIRAELAIRHGALHA